MVSRIAINGLGRIGRLVLRQLMKYPELQLVVVNDVVPADNLAYLLTYDSIHGRWSEKVEAMDGYLTIAGRKILVYNERDPSLLPWADLGIDFVVEATGLFTNNEGASKHLQAGAQRVVITAPAKGEEIPTFVMGVNER